MSLFQTRLSILACILAVLATPLAVLKGEEPQNVAANIPQIEIVKTQIKKLNAPDTLDREDAERELLKLGAAALPLLKEAIKSPEPEIAARAQHLLIRLTSLAAKPVSSYSESFPATSVFFLEAPRSRETLDTMKNTPLGKAWDLPSTQKYYKTRRDGELPNTQKEFDAIREIPKLLSGKALLALGAPETAEAVELDPPLVYIVESQQSQALEQQLRALFDGMTDAPKGTRKYGPFTVEEHITAQTVFGQDSVIHALTQVGIEAMLDNLLKRPAKPLSPLLADIEAALPNYDFVFHLSSDGFKQLSDAAQLIDDDQIKMFDTAGFVSGSRWQSVLKLNTDGFEELNRLTFGGGEKNAGIFALLASMGTALPPPKKPGEPQALDLIPWQAAAVISFQGDAAKYAPQLAKALGALDELTVPAVQAPQPIKPMPAKPQAAAPPKQGEKELTAPPNGDVKDLVREVLGKDKPADKDKADPNAAPKDNAAPADAPEASHPHLARFENIGMKFERLLSQIDGPAHLALFMQQIEGEKVPDSFPVSPLYAVMLKDPQGVEQALEAASAGPAPRFHKEVLNGGVHYVEQKGDPESRPGFWLKNNYLAYSTERDLLDLAGQALNHQAGTERMADRASYKQAWARKSLSQDAILTIFGDADQMFEMPYKLAKINWQDDDADPWPAYAEIKPLLIGKPIVGQARAHKGGLEIKGQSPLSLFGTFEFLRRTLKEAGF